MAETKKENKIEINPFLFRYPPNTRFINGAFKNQIEQKIVKDDFGESIVDKESYRLSLASKRGAIGNGSAQSGWYMFPDGKYNELNDFSTFMRKDLTIVDIDRYIEQMKLKLENSDETIRKDIQDQIEAAQAYKENKSVQDNDNGSNGAE